MNQSREAHHSPRPHHYADPTTWPAPTATLYADPTTWPAPTATLYADPTTWPAPTATLVCQDDQYGTVAVPSSSATPATAAVGPPRCCGCGGPARGELDLDLVWRAYTHRFDLEHTVRFCKQTLGWTTPRPPS